MKKIATLFLALFTFIIQGQTVLFHENFDQPSGPDSVTTMAMQGSSATLWNDTNSVYTSPGQSYHVKGSVVGSQVYFVTPPFSTIGSYGNVYLNFRQIAKLYNNNAGYISVSNDSGTTWITLVGTDYLGSSTNFNFGFNALSYPDWGGYLYSGPLATPTNDWWKEEYFDITSIAINPATGQGYSNVIVRFDCSFPGIIPNVGFLSGWYIDDVKVIGSQCEIIPPTISQDNYQSCWGTDPIQGPYSSPSTFSATLRFSATDNMQIDSLRIVEEINGVPQQRSLSYYSNNRFTANFSGYSAFDTIKYRVEAYDTCGNMASLPDTGFYKFYFGGSYPKCPGGNCSSAHGFINTFPWKQDFEDSIWVPSNQSSWYPRRGIFPSHLSYELIPPQNQPYGWCIRSGSTPNILTGPAGDHTSGNGKYIYSDFYGRTSTSFSVFTLPCVNLEDSISRYLSFYYHMFGSDIKRLTVQIDSSKSYIPNWHVGFDILSEQHSNELSPWTKGVVDLSPYNGKVIKIRFTAIMNPSTTQLANVALDDIAIKNLTNKDIAANAILKPSPTQLACYGSSTVQVEANFSNLSAMAVSKVTVCYQLDNNPVVFDTLDFSYHPVGFDTNFVFNSTLNYNAATAHTLKVWSAQSGDTINTNDTVSIEIPIQQYSGINVFPHFLDFENDSAVFNTPGVLNSIHWILNTGSDTNVFWEINQGPFNFDQNGPVNVQGINNKCLVFRHNTSHSPQTYAELQSQCIDLSGLTSPVFQFQYHAKSNSPIEVYIKESENVSWTQLVNSLPSTGSKKNTKGASYNLSAYSGKVIQLKIQVKNQSNLDNMVAIDNILIREQPTVDLELTKIGLSVLNEGDTSLMAIKCFMTNWSQNTSGNLPTTLKIALKDQCNANAPIVTGQSQSISTIPSGLNVDMLMNNITFNSPVPSGRYEAKFWLETVSDTFSANDTVYKIITCLSPINLPYVNDFEDCNPGVSIYGTAEYWQAAHPGKTNIDSAYHGNKCMITLADSLTLQSSGEYFELPPFYGLDTLHGVRLSFWQNFNFQNYDGFGIVQISDGQNWKDLTSGKAYGVNWKSYIGNIYNNPNYTTGFIGNSNGWIHSSYPLEEFKGPGKKIIRFTTSTFKVEGWAIDSISIDFPEQNSASAEKLIPSNQFIAQGSNNAKIKIRNTARAPLDQVELTIESGGITIHNELLSFQPPIAPGKASEVALNQPFVVNQNATELLIYTSNPNSRKDEIVHDDTIRFPIHILPNVDSIPLCFDFEQTLDFAPYSDLTGLITTGWTKGAPSKRKINASHQGLNSWFTSDSNYAQLLNSYLYTPALPVTGGKCYRFSFWHQYDTELNFDGGQVEFSLDSGQTWNTLGRYWSTDSMWYTTQYIQSLDAFKPGWSGQSDGWVLAQQEFNTFSDGAIQFRFRFASNTSISGEGWAIDDVCFEPLTGKCETISLQELAQSNDAISLYPVPAGEELHLITSINYNWPITILDSKGSIVQKWNQTFENGNIITIDISELPRGIYWLNIQSDTPVTKKFIKL